MRRNSNRKLYFKGTVAPDGVTLLLDHPDIVKHALSNLIGKDLAIDVAKFSKSRSAKQNRWLWGVAYTLIKGYMEETQGEIYTLEEIHAHNMTVIQKPRVTVKTVMGQEVIITDAKKSSQMSTVEFNEMKDKMQEWYWDNIELEIPDPIQNSLITDYYNYKPKRI